MAPPRGAETLPECCSRSTSRLAMPPHRDFTSWTALPRLLLVITLTLPYLPHAFAQPAIVQFQDCFSSSNTSIRLDVSTVYAQVLSYSSGGSYLNFTVIGSSPQEIVESTNDVASESIPGSDWMPAQTFRSDPLHEYPDADIQHMGL